MRQFNLIQVAPSTDGKTVKGTIIDKDYTYFDNLDLPTDVKLLGEDKDGSPIVRFPKSKLVQGNVLDLSR